MRIFSLTSSFIFLLAGICFIPEAMAQKTVSISPLIMEMEIEGDKSYVREIIVKNTNGIPYEITFEAFDVEINPQNHNVSFLPPESKGNRQKSLASWIVPESPTQFVVNPDEAVPFRFSFAAPLDAVAGDYYGSLNFYYRPQSQVKNGNVQVRQSLGSLLLVSLNGTNASAPTEPYNVSRLVLNRKAEETEVSVDFSNETLRFIHLKPLISLQDPTGEIYYQKEGLSKRVFPGEKAHVLHAFPNVYLAAAQDLTLHYSLWDKGGDRKLYQEKVPLDSLRSAAGFDTSRLREWLLIGAGILLVAAGGVYLRRRMSMPVSSHGRRRKRK